MTRSDTIELYLKQLSKALRGLPDDERDDILNEIGAHLEHREDEGQLETALQSLGTPAACARAFRDELMLQAAFDDGGPRQTFGALLSLATRRTVAAFGLLFAGMLLIMSIAMAVSAVVEMINPETVGLWVNNGGQDFVFGTIKNLPGETYSEVLGRWYFPVAIVLAVALYIVSQLTGRGFLKLMIGRQKILP
ncbi:MAG: DUF1700 domain-containing protein [Hyphomonadaceae bacterium]